MSTPIYHITNIDNLAGVIRTGGLLCDAERARRKLPCVNIAYKHLKERRAGTFVRVRDGSPPGAWGVLADYVPFYFANRSPMLYTISRGSVEGYAAGRQGDIVYLVTTVETAVAGSRHWCFTDGHAVEAMTEFHVDTAHLDKIDWETIKARYWSRTEQDPDRRRRKQAEFLVHGFAPWPWFHRIGVIDHARSQRVGEIIAAVPHQPEVSIEPGWYY